MLEIQQLRNDLNTVTEALAKRGYTFPVSAFNALEAERKTIQTKTQDLQAQRNAASKKLAMPKVKVKMSPRLWLRLRNSAMS